jgi:arylsulfatase A-like enzyme
MNIVIITIDTLRADHLGCYGYPLPTSSAIDALARESVVFDQAFAAGIPTMPSFTTMLTGLHPYRHGIVAHAGPRRVPDSIVMLPQLAQARGYVTAACDNLVVQSEGRGSWFARGYDYYSGFLYKPFSGQSAQLTNRALSFVDEYADAPLFLFLHYWDPHTPYGPRPPYDTMHYRPGSGPVDLADVIAIAPEYYPPFLGDMKLRHADDYAYVVAQYDGEISQVDAEVGRLIAGLKARDCWENTVVVLLADHGEAFGEGGLFFDHHGLYDAVTRVAMMARIPGQAPGRIPALVSTEDLLPTLCDLAGLPLPPYPLTGASLLPLLDGSREAVRDQLVLAESTRQASLALRTQRWKLILPITRDASGRPLPNVYGRPRSPALELYDLQADPGERHNLAAELPERADALLRALHDWRDETARVTGAPDPIEAGGLTLPYDTFMARLLGR